ncbi:phosphatidylinositol-glycan biosynthesis class X protein [Pholidichthys leucotaenia]
MYFKLFRVISVLVYLSACHCPVAKGENEHPCGLLKQSLESASVLVELSRKGFHRELITTVKLRPDELGDVTFLLVYRFPRGVYVDPYQLASLIDQSNWQILLNSAIDLEAPAHKTSGFVAYVYPFYCGPTASVLKIKIPVHGRYHKPSFVGEIFTTVDINAPELLLRTEKCTHFKNFERHSVIEAPCTVSNSSTCSWVKIQHQQEPGSVSFEFPVGDGSLVTPVCGGTLLVTMICCVVLSRYMWKHRIIQTT